MPYSRRTAFFLGGGKAMINALTATELKLGVAIGYDTSAFSPETCSARATSLASSFDAASARSSPGRLLISVDGKS